ncbi:MAG: hypothetical protein ACYTEX_26650, partial [Planctomycetota bacterium]
MDIAFVYLSQRRTSGPGQVYGNAGEATRIIATSLFYTLDSRCQPLPGSKQETSDDGQGFEEFYGLGVSAAHAPDEFAGAHLGQDVFADGELADGDIAGGELGQAKNDAEAKLADHGQAGGELAQAQTETQGQLADSDQAEGGMAYSDDSAGKAAYGDDALGDHAAAGFGVSAERVMDQRQAHPRTVRRELVEARAVDVA